MKSYFWEKSILRRKILIKLNGQYLFRFLAINLLFDFQKDISLVISYPSRHHRLFQWCIYITYIHIKKKVYLSSDQQLDTNKFCHWWPGKHHCKSVLKIHHSLFLNSTIRYFVSNQTYLFWTCAAQCISDQYEIVYPCIPCCVTAATQQKDYNVLCWSRLTITWALQLQFGLFCPLWI